MTKRHASGRMLALFTLAAIFLATDVGFDGSNRLGISLIGTAQAKVVIRRSTVYVATLPRGCVRTTMGGVVVWRCGKTYYQPYKGRYVVVTVR